MISLNYLNPFSRVPDQVTLFLVPFSSYFDTGFAIVRVALGRPRSQASQVLIQVLTAMYVA